MPKKDGAAGQHDDQDASHQRARIWGDYFEQVLIEHNFQTRKLLASKAAIARYIGLSAVTIGDWLNRKAVPSRKNCAVVALTLQRPLDEVLTNAGYAPDAESHYATIAGLTQAISEADLSQEERRPLLAALQAAQSPAFMQGAAAEEWRNMVLHILQQKFTPLSKAQKIAAMIALWQQEQGDVATS